MYPVRTSGILPSDMDCRFRTGRIAHKYSSFTKNYKSGIISGLLSGDLPFDMRLLFDIERHVPLDALQLVLGVSAYSTLMCT